MRVLKQFIQKLCLLALAAGFLFCACGAGAARLPQGCAIDGQNVSGMSVPCARRLLLRRPSRRQARSYSFPQLWAADIPWTGNLW